MRCTEAVARLVVVVVVVVVSSFCDSNKYIRHAPLLVLACLGISPSSNEVPPRGAGEGHPTVCSHDRLGSDSLHNVDSVHHNV